MKTKTASMNIAGMKKRNKEIGKRETEVMRSAPVGMYSYSMKKKNAGPNTTATKTLRKVIYVARKRYNIFAQFVITEQFDHSRSKIPTHTIRIPQIPSNILLYRTLMFRHTSVSWNLWRMWLAAVALCRVIPILQWQGISVHTLSWAPTEGGGYTGVGGVHRWFITHIYIYICLPAWKRRKKRTV